MASKYLKKKVVQSVLNLVPNGQLFTVIFEKVNGKERVMTCRMVRDVARTKDKNINKDLQVVETDDGRRSFYITNVYELRALGMVMASTGRPVKLAEL